MAMKFAKVQYQSTGEFNYEYVEPVKTHFKGFTFKFTKKNLNNLTSSLAIIAKKGNDERIAPCSKPLSQKIKTFINEGKMTQKEAMAFIFTKCWIIEGQNQAGEDRVFIAFAQGQAGEELESFTEKELNGVDESVLNALPW